MTPVPAFRWNIRPASAEGPHELLEIISILMLLRSKALSEGLTAQIILVPLVEKAPLQVCCANTGYTRGCILQIFKSAI